MTLQLLPAFRHTVANFLYTTLFNFLSLRHRIFLFTFKSLSLVNQFLNFITIGYIPFTHSYNTLLSRTLRVTVYVTSHHLVIFISTVCYIRPLRALYHRCLLNIYHSSTSINRSLGASTSSFP